jgi:phosphoglycerol transferase MdoB-like AlkP superfamily enzyme
MESLALWALARLLPPYTGEDSKNLARSLRRRFALVGLLFGLAPIGTLWNWTANIAVTCGASVVMLAGLWLYSEHWHRPQGAQADSVDSWAT